MDVDGSIEIRGCEEIRVPRVSLHFDRPMSEGAKCFTKQTEKKGSAHLANVFNCSCIPAKSPVVHAARNRSAHCLLQTRHKMPFSCPVKVWKEKSMRYAAVTKTDGSIAGEPFALRRSHTVRGRERRDSEVRVCPKMDASPQKPALMYRDQS